MKKEKVILKTKEQANRDMVHLPNPMHAAACLKGGQVHKNKKKYTRKEKHRKDYE